MAPVIKKALVILSVSLLMACSHEAPLQGHQLSVSAVEQPHVSWITEKDVERAEAGKAARGEPTLRLHLRPDAAQRMLTLTGANIGKKVRFTWDGAVVSELEVASAFGPSFELPAPPR
jgi:preprotein translocase subunit SecD